MSLEGKVAIVTGAGRGLGRAIALAYAREGAAVTLMSRTREEIERVTGETKELGGKSLVFVGDVSKEQDVAEMVTRTLEQFFKVDILVNNAAVIGPARFLDADFRSWRETIDINLNSAFLCSRNVAPIMAQRGGGKIVSISSGLGRMGFPRFCAYAVSKAGIIQMTRSLSEELAPHNIQVNAIDPGVMDTTMQERIRAMGVDELGEEIHHRFVSFWKEGYLKAPEQVAPLAVFLASPKSDHITGRFGGLEEYTRLGWRP
jgi:NAD(P)-dependent dehydrogenase (short-subunit alcohol dehydrogenase family)